MISAQAILAALERQQTSKSNVSGWRIVGRAIPALLGVAVVGGILAFSAYRLWLAWQTAQWTGFWFLSFFAIFFLIVPVIPLSTLTGPLNQIGQLTRAIEPLRQIAAAGEDALTPIVTPQPAPLPTGALAAGPIEIKPIKRLMPTAVRIPGVFLVFWLVFMSIFFVPLVSNDFDLGQILPISFNLFDFFGPENPASVAFFPLFIMVIPFVILTPILLRFLPLFTNRTVIADEHGLRWRDGRFGAKRSIAWSDARSFSRISTTLMNAPGAYGLMNMTSGMAYLLDSPNATLIWTLSPAASDAIYSASERLCSLIVTRTNLPLRDLTALANDLVATRGNVQRIAAMRFPSGSAAPVSPTLQALAQQPTPQQPRRWPRVVSLIAVSLIPLVLFSTIMGYGSYVEHYQQSYFAGLPQRVQAETPIFQDSLTTADGYWTVNPVTTEQPEGAKFANGSYELIGTNQTVINYNTTSGAGILGDAAIEVTASEQGTVDQNSSDGIGIVFAVTGDGNNFGVFEVHDDGQWELDAYHNIPNDLNNSWDYLDGGDSAAIYQGIGATNQLLLIRRGKTLLCYVNDQYVGAYYDKDNEIPATGEPGVFINDGALTGVFTNFAVYPVQPPTSLWYI